VVARAVSHHLAAGAKIYWSHHMTKFLAAVALAALVASPALAATKHRSHAAMNAMASDTSQNAYAPGFGYSAVGPNGAAIGTDPDPFIRQSLHALGDQNWAD
jgi:hypothetical protein